MRLLSLQHVIEPHEELEFEYCIRRVEPEQIDRLEISVVWYTEGKGTEDIGVHLFETYGPEQLKSAGCESPQIVSTKLPASPLSYEGRLFKIRWCCRIRLFLTDGREISTEQPFYLGHLTNEV